MNKEFPVDRFFRKNSMKIAITIIVLMLLVIFGPSMVPVVYHPMIANIMMMGMSVFMVGMVGLLIWQVCWRIKYPTKREYCKDCRQILPIKYED